MSSLIKRLYSTNFGAITSAKILGSNNKNKRKELNQKTNVGLVKENFDDESNSERLYVSSDLLNISEVKKTNKHTLATSKTTELLYGIYPVLFALKSNRRTFSNIYLKKLNLDNNIKFKEINELCQKLSISTKYIDRKRFSFLLGPGKVHQGICLEASQLPSLVYDNYSQDEKSKILKNSKAKYQLWLYLDQINDPMNFGAILRTAYYFGVSQVFTSVTNSCPITSVVSKASSGVAEILPVHQIINIEDFIQCIKNNGWQIVSTSTHSSVALPLEKYAGTEKVLLIIGNEGRGVSPALEKNSDVALTVLPHPDCVQDAQALNVSVATAVILHSLSSKMQRN